MRGTLSGGRVAVKKDLGQSLLEKGFGEDCGEYILLSPEEALLLLERGTLEVNGETFDSLLQKFCEAEKNFLLKYTVFKDLRQRGYVVKTGFKFGGDLRVYPRGKKPGEAHTKWVVLVLPEEGVLPLKELARSLRVAQSVRAELLLAVVDKEGDVIYYEVKREKP